MLFKIIYRNDTGVHECIVGAESEPEALLLVKKENPINGKIEIKEVIEIIGNGIFLSKMIKNFNPGSAYEHFLKEKESNSYNKYVTDLKEKINDLK